MWPDRRRIVGHTVTCELALAQVAVHDCRAVHVMPLHVGEAVECRAGGPVPAKRWRALVRGLWTMTALRHDVRANCAPKAVWALLGDLEAVQRYNPTVRS